MPKINPSKFEKIELTEEELKIGMSFQGLNLLVLKQIRADLAEQKLQLRVQDPNDIKQFLQEEAELHGRLDLLNILIGD